MLWWVIFFDQNKTTAIRVKRDEFGEVGLLKQSFRCIKKRLVNKSSSFVWQLSHKNTRGHQVERSIQSFIVNCESGGTPLFLLFLQNSDTNSRWWLLHKFQSESLNQHEIVCESDSLIETPTYSFLCTLFLDWKGCCFTAQTIIFQLTDKFGYFF